MSDPEVTTIRGSSAVGTGVVTTWDPELVNQARQFAEAHGRRLVQWPRELTPDAFGEAIRDAASLTVFVSVREMTHPLLQSLIVLSVRGELPLGLVPCAPKSQIPLTPPSSPPLDSLRRRSLLYSYFFAGHGISGVPDVHGRPDWEPFLEQAELGAEVLVLHTHGNGADAPIGEVVLCARVDGGLASSRSIRCLPCHVDGPCIREHRGFRWYLGPSHLRCHALVFLSCTGFPPADSLLEYEGSLVHAALRGGTIRSIVTSIQVDGSSTFALALSAKCYIDDGHTMGELALAINHADAASLPHYICIGDPEHRPIDGGLEPGPIREIPEPPVGDPLRALKTLVVLAEAELLARLEPTPWLEIDERLHAVGELAHTPAHVPLPAPPTLIGARDLALERVTERVYGLGSCPSCPRPASRHRARLGLVRRDLRLESCPEHGITAVEADLASAGGDEPTTRAARWLFTALSLRRLAEQLESHREPAMELAHALERGAFAGAAEPASQELDRRIAGVFGASAAAGGELFLTRQLRHVSVAEHGVSDQVHDCGRCLMYVDFSPIPLRVRRRVWSCPLCGVVGNTTVEHGLPEISVAAGRWHATPMPAPFAAEGCALTLAWESRGLYRDDSSVSRWIDGPSEGELRCSAQESFAGLRALDAILVADAEVSTVRVPVLASSDRRLFSLRELNDADYPRGRAPWDPREGSAPRPR